MKSSKRSRDQYRHVSVFVPHHEADQTQSQKSEGVENCKFEFERSVRKSVVNCDQKSDHGEVAIDDTNMLEH